MMRDNSYQIIIDTNLWISFLIKNFNTRLIHVLVDPAIQVIYTDELIIEIKQTVSYSRLSKKISTSAVDELTDTFKTYFTKVQVVSEITICRDPKDNYLLSLAKDAQAHFLITNDEDLLVLHPFENTSIVKLADFLTILQTTT